MRLAIRSEPQYLEPVRTVIRDVTLLAGFGDEETAEVVLAVTEGLTNVIRHCYGNCPDERIDLTMTFRSDEFEIRIDDYGKYVDPGKMRGRDLKDVKPGGLGVHLMKKVMDRLEYRPNAHGGTSLVMVKRLPRTVGPGDGARKATKGE
jgi:anti-sigma regulatory factor (Ser/Thr protein kinase)